MVSRYKEGPKLNGLDPILVVFEQQKEKESVWARIKENHRNSQVVVTQFDSRKKLPSVEARPGEQMKLNTSVKDKGIK